MQSLRILRKEEYCLKHRFLSLKEDQDFCLSWINSLPNTPVFCNLRCGKWYVPPTTTVCYFKSTDGHFGNWDFSTTRLNLHVAMANKGEGVLVVDSTRKGKSFPDSLSKTIPIWCCVINRAVRLLRLEAGTSLAGEWDESLHLPLSISINERVQIEAKLDGFVAKLLRCGVDLTELVAALRKPLRPMWVNRNSHMWAESSVLAELAFSPVICLTASNSEELGVGERKGWTYVQGAGDDEEAWSCGLTPAQFWLHSERLLALPPLECEQLVSSIVDTATTAEAKNSNIEIISLGEDVFLLEAKTNILSYELLLRYRIVITSESLASFGELGEYCSHVTCFEFLPCKVHSQVLIENIVDDKRAGHSLERALNAILAFSSPSTATATPIDTTTKRPLLIVTPDPGVGVVLAAAILQAREINVSCSKQCMKQVLAQVTSAYGKPVYPSRYLAKQLNRFFLSSKH